MDTLVKLALFEIGTYECPKKHTLVVLKLPVPLTALEWPVTVERCQACEQEHVLQYEDVCHAPALGYE